MHAYAFLNAPEKLQLRKLLKAPREVQSVIDSDLNEEQKADNETADDGDKI